MPTVGDGGSAVSHDYSPDDVDAGDDDDAVAVDYSDGQMLMMMLMTLRFLQMMMSMMTWAMVADWRWRCR